MSAELWSLHSLRIVFSDLLDLVVFPDQRLIVESKSHAGLSVTTRDHLLADQLLPRILAHGGKLVLHAGAVRRNDRSIIFVGDSGYGKSSLVASFDRAGYPLLGDDALVISQQAGLCCAAAVYPSLRLFPDSVDALLSAGTETDAVALYTSKLRVNRPPDTNGEPNRPLPVEAIFILARPSKSDEIQVLPITTANSCISLVKNSFALDPTDSLSARKRLNAAGVLAAQVPAYQISYPHDYSKLPQVRAAITAVLGSSVEA